MFLKIAALLAALGVLLSLLLTLIQQVVLIGGFYSSGIQYFFRILNIGAALSLTVPLMIFFVAFFLSLNSKTGSTSVVSK